MAVSEAVAFPLPTAAHDCYPTLWSRETDSRETMVWRGVAAAAAVLCMQQAQAFQVTLKNQCSGDMTLFDSSTTETIAEGSSTTRTIAADSGAHVYRYGTGAQATCTFSSDCAMRSVGQQTHARPIGRMPRGSVD